MNVELLKRVADAIVARPSDFDMARFECPVAESRVKNREASCGIVACIGGWASTLANGATNPVVDEELSYNYYADLLGLEWSEGFFENDSESDRLMLLTKWPREYKDLYECAPTDADRARVAYDRIHHFIATDGKE